MLIFVYPVAIIIAITYAIYEHKKKKGDIDYNVSDEKSDKMIDKQDFLKEHDKKIAQHSEAIEPTRMERVSLHVERLSEQRKPIKKVKEVILNEEVVRREIIHSKIDVNDLFTCRDDVIKGIIYKEILSKPKGLK